MVQTDTARLAKHAKDIGGLPEFCIPSSHSFGHFTSRCTWYRIREFPKCQKGVEVLGVTIMVGALVNDHSHLFQMWNIELLPNRPLTLQKTRCRQKTFFGVSVIDTLGKTTSKQCDRWWAYEGGGGGACHGLTGMDGSLIIKRFPVEHAGV